MFFKSVLAASFIFLCCSTASAHDMWATAENPQVGEKLTAVVGYGHNFPSWDEIPADELHLFKPLKVIGPKGELSLEAGPVNYKFVSQQPLGSGAHLIICDTKPVFWTKTPKGWSQKPRSQEPEALSSDLFIENAKGIINPGMDTDASLISKPVGLPLEIVPLRNPTSVKAGEKLPLKILFQGQPLAGATVEGRQAAMAQTSSPNAKAFVDVTDKDGVVNFVPLASGDWLLTVRHVRPYPDKNECDSEDFGSSLFFSIP